MPFLVAFLTPRDFKWTRRLTWLSIYTFVFIFGKNKRKLTVEGGPKTDPKTPVEEEDCEESLGPKRSIVKEEEEDDEVAPFFLLCSILGFLFSMCCVK